MWEIEGKRKRVGRREKEGERYIWGRRRERDMGRGREREVEERDMGERDGGRDGGRERE